MSRLKPQNRANIKAYFDDGSSLSLRIIPGSPAAHNRAALIAQLEKFIGMLKPTPLAYSSVHTETKSQ